jgi:hypothetical protein
MHKLKGLTTSRQFMELPKSYWFTFYYFILISVSFTQRDKLAAILIPTQFYFRFPSTYVLQCPPLNKITSGQHKSDNNNRMIQLTDVFCTLSIYNWAGNI